MTWLSLLGDQVAIIVRCPRGDHFLASKWLSLLSDQEAICVRCPRGDHCIASNGDQGPDPGFLVFFGGGGGLVKPDILPAGLQQSQYPVSDATLIKN